MIEVVELFNEINKLTSRYWIEESPRHPRHLTRTTQPDSILCLDAKSLILNTASMDSTDSSHSIVGGPPLDAVRLATGQTLYGLTPTALRRWSYSNLALRRMANLSTRWSNIGQDCRESEGVLGLQIALQLER